ncbi:hypothetical protein INH39_25100 [Massilia violaceinigra]|uniref:Uncharacterized protein n=1 Tax=Massilia violaceinigra TaxID=2045208 RepID=A0ABY4A1R5_9BURK|nr:hypothetical protein [Massilia violaceinigra]UOD28690.1 hypothetical protein INH39_25100 [Massilia violaceinigra]
MQLLSQRPCAGHRGRRNLFPQHPRSHYLFPLGSFLIARRYSRLRFVTPERFLFWHAIKIRFVKKVICSAILKRANACLCSFDTTLS